MFNEIGQNESPGFVTPIERGTDGALHRAGLNTIRQAGPTLLVDDGLVETRQGVGSFVLRAEPVPRPVDVLAELRTARSALERAITALERAEDEKVARPPA